jgi:hypothetical protein
MTGWNPADAMPLSEGRLPREAPIHRRRVPSRWSVVAMIWSNEVYRPWRRNSGRVAQSQMYASPCAYEMGAPAHLCSQLPRKPSHRLRSVRHSCNKAPASSASRSTTAPSDIPIAVTSAPAASAPTSGRWRPLSFYRTGGGRRTPSPRGAALRPTDVATA